MHERGRPNLKTKRARLAQSPKSERQSWLHAGPARLLLRRPRGYGAVSPAPRAARRRAEAVDPPMTAATMPVVRETSSELVDG
jgi:hypothetical protein